MTDKNLLKRTSLPKKIMKEKIIQIYEQFFNGENPSLGNINFWDEFFLLKVNSNFIETELDKMNGDQLIKIMANLNMLMGEAVEAMYQNHTIRILNALQTIAIVSRVILGKCCSNSGFEAINILIGFDNAEKLMQRIIERVNFIILFEFPDQIKSLALTLLLVFTSSTENISQNTILEYFMMNSVFETIIEIVGNTRLMPLLGSDALQLLTVLIQYRKHESTNPYILKLSILDDELPLRGISNIISTNLSKYNRQYQITKTRSESSGIFSILTNMVGSMFVGEEVNGILNNTKNCVLLALYETVHLNRNFITTLTHSHASSPLVTPEADSNEKVDLESAGESVEGSTPGELVHPSNLLTTFLEFTSVISQDIKDPVCYSSTKLCFIILTCITEDQYANTLIHDLNLNFRVNLHRIPMRHRKSAIEKSPPLRPLVCSLLDLIIEFTMGHMMKNFPWELHMKSIGIVHRILCYQKKCRVRLKYPWKELWNALISLLKFLLSNESTLLKKHDIFHLCIKIVNIFNLFITFGDMFLLDTNSYDDLYYEVIRVHHVFENLDLMSLRYSSLEDLKWKEAALRLNACLSNIRSLGKHFNAKLDAWSTDNNFTSLTPEQVLEVVRENYDSLTLKMQDNLDQFDRYCEKPREISFFSHIVREIIKEIQKSSTEMYINSPQILNTLLSS